MGEAGVGLLNAALGLGGLVGAVFAVSLTRTDRLDPDPGGGAGLLGRADRRDRPHPVARGRRSRRWSSIGVANAVFDVAIFTIFQRGTANEERAPVFSVFEGLVGLGSVTGSLLAPVLLAAFGIRGALARHRRDPADRRAGHLRPDRAGGPDQRRRRADAPAAARGRTSSRSCR